MAVCDGPLIEERFLSTQADPFAGSEWGRKSRPAPFEMTVGRSSEVTMGRSSEMTMGYPSGIAGAVVGLEPS